MAKYLSRARCMRRFTAVVAAAAVLGVAGPHTVPVDAVALPTASAAQSPEKTANQRAAESGERVEVEGQRTETGKTYANPDGTMTLEQAASPVRKRRNGQWVELDPTMSRVGDKVRPAATAIDMEFSDGGDKDLVSFTDEGHRLSLSWPEPLPAPVIEGDKLVYPSVYPDVDLQLNVTKDTFTQVLVVRTPTAAKLPQLQEIEIGLDAPGMTVRRSALGGVEAFDESGEVAFSAPRPAMWDSSGARLAQPKTADRTEEPLEGDTVAPMAVEVSSNSLSVLPDQAFVNDPQTKYPLQIDPPFSGPRIARAMINEHYPTTPTWNWGGDEGVGYQAFEPWSRKRLFFGFSISTIAKSQIISANFLAFETWAASCTPKAVEVWKTAKPTENTTWNSGSGSTVWQQKLSIATVANGRDGCSPGGYLVPFNVKTAVAQQAAANSSAIYLGMRAADESDQNAWKRFRYDVILTVQYNNFPVVHNPHLADPEAPCATSASNDPSIGSTKPRLTVAITDADNDSVHAEFQIRRAVDSAPYWTGSTASKTGGITSEFDFTPATAMWASTTYAWRARAVDINGATTPWSSECYFFIDTTRPPPPTITPVTLAPYTVGSQISLKFGTSGTDVVTLKYTLNVDAVPSASIPLSPGTATVTPTHFGVQVIRAWTVDGAGNTSIAPASLTFSAADRDEIGRWRMDEGSGMSTADITTNGRTMYLGSNVDWAVGDQGEFSDPVDRALWINGLQTTGGTTATTATNLVDSAENFSVGVRVKPGIKSNRQVIVSEDRPGVSGFTLGSSEMSWIGKDTADSSDDDPDDRTITWEFTLATSAGTFHLTTKPIAYNAAAAAETERWVYLFATYNKGTKIATLSVNGPDSPVSHSVAGTVVDGTGPFRTGLGIDGGSVTHFYRGYLDDLILFDGSLVTEAKIRSLKEGDN